MCSLDRCQPVQALSDKHRLITGLSKCPTSQEDKADQHKGGWHLVWFRLTRGSVLSSFGTHSMLGAQVASLAHVIPGATTSQGRVHVFYA